MKCITLPLLASFSLLLMGGCDQQPSQLPHAASQPSTAPAAAPIQGPISQQADEAQINAHIDPARLADTARYLTSIGYTQDAQKLYQRACDLGYTAACGNASPIEQPRASIGTSSTTEGPPAKASADRKVATTSPIPSPAPSAQLPNATPSTQSTAGPRQTTLSKAPTMQQPMTKSSQTENTVSPIPPQKSEPAPTALASLDKRQGSLPSAATVAPPPQPSDAPKALGYQAQHVEQLGYLNESLVLYKRACLDGDGQACKRLGEIFIKGSNGIKRDYAESIRWYDRARKLGVAVPALEKREALYR